VTASRCNALAVSTSCGPAIQPACGITFGSSSRARLVSSDTQLVATHCSARARAAPASRASAIARYHVVSTPLVRSFSSQARLTFPGVHSRDCTHCWLNRRLVDDRRRWPGLLAPSLTSSGYTRLGQLTGRLAGYHPAPRRGEQKFKRMHRVTRPAPRELTLIKSTVAGRNTRFHGSGQRVSTQTNCRAFP